ncbi:hypothetical protein ATHL_00752 [Anaerolinea thermolimosa]|uniref:hypothetical protein n=1 Tax=Anaerolinea thermolimosa TaxID=229919 RepID=UPI00078031A4|nr:hypothetical protein [Anaerolinea thermolimosa]GAP05911.1 hypothetical protein ATHL_00752 [Anaerolinea thermolimosa]
MNSTWKATERAIARRLGGKRVPITGRARGSAPDVAHTWLSIEVKHRKRLPRWLADAIDQAVAAAVEGQLPIVILHESGQRHDNDLVLTRLSDFESWFGSIGGDDED